MPAEVRIRTLSVVLPASTTSIDLDLTSDPLASADLTRAFVRLLSSPSGSYYVRPDASVVSGIPINTDEYSATVTITNQTTVRATTQAGGTPRAKYVVFELWEYLGAAGGPNEFIARAQSSVVVSVVGGAIVLPFTATNAYRVLFFPRGIIWTGAISGAAPVPGSGNVVIYSDVFFGLKWLRYARGVNDVNNIPDCHYAAVEFKGSNWGVGYVGAGATPPVGTVDEPTFAGTIPTSWSKTILFGQRRCNDHINASQGLVIWPHPTLLNKCRVSYAAGGSTAAGWNTYFIQALSNKDAAFSVEHKDSIDGGQPDHAGVGSPPGSKSSIIVLTSGVLATLDDAALFVHSDEAMTSSYAPSHIWSTELFKTISPGDYRVLWTRATRAGASRWSQQVVSMRFTTQVTRKLGTPLTVDVLTDTWNIENVGAVFPIAAELAAAGTLDAELLKIKALLSELEASSFLDAETLRVRALASEFLAICGLFAYFFIPGCPHAIPAIGVAVDVNSELVASVEALPKLQQLVEVAGGLMLDAAVASPFIKTAVNALPEIC